MTKSFNCNQDIEALQNVITQIDSYSQEGNSDIATIARLTIKAIESGTCANPIDDVLNVLRMIWDKTDDIKNLINCEAESVGCNHISKPLQREINKALEES